MIYCFDIDNTLCTQDGANYKEAKPLFNRIVIVNGLYDRGHTIKLFTARGGTSGIDWKDVTENQLRDWEIKYHELIIGGKPHADYFIDDKSVHPNKFFNDNYNEE